ncbi:putrescine ABC transporter membrane protein [Escherichia coli]|uniref:Putrescine ABC transporter membrane protein n=1 Tax=Escherichia coli TaxID=562 RepID=A0A376VKN0_ECOLX|nr:putrescine ABC transporter membrane protein [Escherichia coli]
MIMPAIISGWLLAFTLSLDDLVIASFVSGPGATTLPMLVFSSVRMGVNPEINALATLILCAVGIVGFYRLVSDGARRKTADTRHPACKTWLKTLKFANLAT